MAALDEVDSGAAPARARRAPLRTIDTTPPSAELLAQLLSDEPIPPPISIPMAAPPPVDPRAVYLEHVRANGIVRLLVRVLDITPGVLGSIARVEVLRSSPAGVRRSELRFPEGMSCQVGEVRAGETILVHVNPTRLADRSALVPIITVWASPIVSRAYQETDGSYRVRFPWGDEAFDALLEAE